MNDNFSPRVKNVVNTGKLEAIRMKHSVVGTEHLLLGILKETDGSRGGQETPERSWDGGLHRLRRRGRDLPDGHHPVGGDGAERPDNPSLDRKSVV